MFSVVKIKGTKIKSPRSLVALGCAADQAPTLFAKIMAGESVGFESTKHFTWSGKGAWVVCKFVGFDTQDQRGTREVKRYAIVDLPYGKVQ